MTEPLPRGANFKRSKFLWEIGLDIAGNPATPYGGNRDMCIVVGNGSGEAFRPWLRMATGSPILAHDVAKGGIEMAMVNPSAFLTQAYRGVGLFKEPLPLRAIGTYPSWDRFCFLVNPKTGIKSLRDIKEQKYPLYVSVKEDVTHSTRVFIDQALSFYGFSLADIVSWGGRLNVTGAPNDPRRMNALRSGELEAIFDEGLVTWFDESLKCGMQLIELEPDHFAYLAKLGWRRAPIAKGRYPHLTHDHYCIDYSGWPLYANASLPDQVAYEAAAAIFRRQDQMVWDKDSYKSARQVFEDTDETQLDVPLHPGAERFYRELLAGKVPPIAGRT
jgi:TRAP-type uncharacterized transport system substrate-binding protein